MHEWEAIWIALEEIQRISAAEDNPVKVHLEVDERRIGLAEKNIQRSDSANRSDLEIVIVVGEPETSCPRLTREFVEQRGHPLPISCCLATLFGKPRQRDPLVADRFGVGKCLRKVFFQQVDRQVCRRRGEAVFREQVADLRRGPPKIAGKFDFIVSNPGDLRERSRKICLHQIADGIKLKSDFVERSSGTDGGGAGFGVNSREAESGDAHGSEKSATGLHCHHAGESRSLVWSARARFAMK